MKYRAEIDGLRAVAVLPVMLFHAGFELLSGGYVGVDVFFVISGYLITGILLDDIRSGRFSLITFYERRARRILPALFLVMLVSLPLAWLWLLPADLKDFAQSLVSISLFSSNILFWQESGYFETSTELKPLLHTWSLAVEEQFYLLFPLLLLLIWRRGHAVTVTVLIILALFSLGTAQWLSSHSPSTGFFLLPSRGWELLFGSLAAIYLKTGRPLSMGPWMREGCSAAGIAMILIAVFTFDANTPVPGLMALLPTTGAVLVILCCDGRTLTGRWLGSRGPVAIGLISYSAYLWHQPLFAFARHKGLGSHDRLEFSALILICLGLAFLSWRFVETPFRDKHRFSQKTIFSLGLLGLALFTLAGLYGHLKNGQLGRYSDIQQGHLDQAEHLRQQMLKQYQTGCDFYVPPQGVVRTRTQAPRDSIPEHCTRKQHVDRPTLFLWGDSHARHLEPGIRQVLGDTHNLLQVTSSGCSAQWDAQQNKSDYCEYSNWYALQAIRAHAPEIVIIGQLYGHDPERMTTIARQLQALGVRQVLFTGPAPRWIPNQPAVVARLLPDAPQRTFRGVDRQVLATDRTLVEATAAHSAYRYASLIDYFCDPAGCMLRTGASSIEAATSWDDGHLTPTASYMFVKDVLAPILQDARDASGRSTTNRLGEKISCDVPGAQVHRTTGSSMNLSASDRQARTACLQ